MHLRWHPTYWSVYDFRHLESGQKNTPWVWFPLVLSKIVTIKCKVPISWDSRGQTALPATNNNILPSAQLFRVSWPFVQLRIRSQVWKDQSVSNQSWKVGKNSIGVKVPEKSWNFFESNWTGGDFKDGNKLNLKLLFNQSSNYSFDRWIH